MAPAPVVSVEGFNPRTHEGCDTMEVGGFLLTIGFNPRTHEGCDFM